MRIEVLVWSFLDVIEPEVTWTAWMTFIQAEPPLTAKVAISVVLTAFEAGCNPMMYTYNKNKEKRHKSERLSQAKTGRETQHDKAATPKLASLCMSLYDAYKESLL